MAMLIQSGSKQEAMYPGDEVNYNQSEVRSLIGLGSNLLNTRKELKVLGV
jgi:hypothetical protein